MDPSMMMQGGMPGAAGAAPQEPLDDGKMVDLVEKIEKPSCYCRNEKSGFPWSNLLIGDDRLGCKSDADEQLILQISFMESVKVHSIKLTEFNGGRDPELQPTKVHLFVNRLNIGFEDADDIDPTQSFELTAADLKEDADPIRLQFVKFQRVRSITFYIEDNAGGDVSALGGLKFFGRTMATTNMNDFKKQPGASD